MVVDPAERRLPHQLDPRPDHPRDPQEVDVPAGRADVAGVEAIEVWALLRPAQGGERPQGRREPRVEDVLVLDQLLGTTFCAGGRLALVDRRVAVRAVPDGDPVPPPQLARHAPGPDVLEVGEHHVRLLLRLGADAAGTERLDRGPNELLHLAPPLQEHERLDPVA